MYDYEEGIKKNNVGFARVESRNGQCKIFINIKALSLNSSFLKGYIFKRTGETTIPIFMGSIPVKNGIADFRIITSENQIMNTDSTLDEMCGIIVYYEKNKFYGTEWDDIPITSKTIDSIANEETKETTKKVEETVPQGVKEPIMEAPAKEEPKPSQPLKPEVVATTILKYQRLSTEQPEVEEINKPVTGEPEKNEKMYEDPECLPPHPAAARIFSRFTILHPFETKEILECVRIEPQDIGVFPMENWVLGNNSFLLHGYYNYRHLIFARRRKENDYQYIIGVPGIYQNREKFLARMFGFDYFQPTETKEEKTGEFGYWYTPIKL